MLQSRIVRTARGSGADGGDDGIALEVRQSMLSDQGRQCECDVLFLPFWGGSASTFDQGMMRLSILHPTINTAAVSYAGTGRTPQPINDRAVEAHSVEPRAECLRSLILNEQEGHLLQSRKLVICAHSMSAKITYALLNMLASDKTFKAEIVGLVLLGPAPVGPLVLPADMREQQLKAYATVESARWTIENVLTYGKLDEETVKGLAEDCAEMSPGAKEGWLKYGMAFDCSGYMKTVGERWPELKVMVLAGEMDQVETVDRVKQQTVVVLHDHGFQVDFRLVRGCGHLLPVEAVDEVAQTVARIL